MWEPGRGASETLTKSQIGVHLISRPPTRLAIQQSKVMMPYILIAIFTLFAGAYVSAVLQNFGLPAVAALSAGVLVVLVVFSTLITIGRHFPKDNSNLPYKGS